MNSEISTYPVTNKKSHSRLSWQWRRFSIQLRSWEYWPVYIFNLPVVFIWLWNVIKTRDLFFFTLTNPGIKTGGFFGESKSQILSQIPEEYKPKTVLWEAPVYAEEIEDLFSKAGLSFPVIAKPEIGERGWLIARIHSMRELKDHIKSHPIDLIIQPFVEMPMELSIMVHRLPDGSKSEVTSICQKEFLNVIGDGVSTVEQLIIKKDRAFLHYEKLKKRLGSDMSMV